MIIWKISWRNLWRHKEKSLIIGMILFLGAMLMTVGNSVIKGAKQGLEENLANRRTGHLTLIAGDEDTQSIFFTEGVQPLKLVPEYPKLKQILQTQDIVEGFVPMSRGYAIILNADITIEMSEEAGESAAILLFGVEFEKYQKLFQHNIFAVEGSLLRKGEKGVLITEKDRKQIYEQYNIWVVPKGCPVIEEAMPPEARANMNQVIIKDELVLLGLSGEGLETDIRVPVKGIISLNYFNAVKIGSFIDIESFRQCFGYFTAADTTVELSEDKAALLAMDDIGDLFADDILIEKTDTEAHYDIKSIQQQTERENLDIKTDEGAYQFVAVKLKSGTSLKEGINHLSRVFTEAQHDLNILSWKQSNGSLTQFAGLTQGVLFMLVLFIFFVAAIVITNTLSLAALERTSEIGMMRAIGATKGFIIKMFLTEIAFLSAIFGGLGMIVGVIIVWGLTTLHLSTASFWMLSLLAGGDVLHPIVDVVGLILGSGELAVVTVLAALYPVMIAKKITPLEAISRE